MNIEHTPQPKNDLEDSEESSSEYSPEIQHVLDSDVGLEGKISKLEDIQDQAQEQLKKITITREKVQNQREEFIKNDELTEERKKDYEETIQVIDTREQAQHEKVKEVWEALRVLAVRSEQNESD